MNHTAARLHRPVPGSNHAGSVLDAWRFLARPSRGIETVTLYLLLSAIWGIVLMTVLTNAL